MPSDYSDIYNMTPTQLLATIGFAEVSKDPKIFEKDAIGIMNVIKNRLKRPERFGVTLYDVILAPNQFSGVGSPEWEKAYQRKFTKEEERIYKRLLQIAHGVLTDKIPDPTGGADHYYNPNFTHPHWADVYQKVYSSGAHDYHSELKPLKSKRNKLTFKEAFAKARREGKKTFYWRGKRYSTRLK